MQGNIPGFARRFAAVLLLSSIVAAPLLARDPALIDRSGKPRTERGQWVYRIVAKWGGHVQEAYRTDPQRWADTMAPAFARAPLPALRKAAQASSFQAMNDALLAASPHRVGTMQDGTKALGDADRDLVYVPVTPCRIIDTRVAGGPIPANGVRDFDVADVVDFSAQGGDSGHCNVGDKGSFAAAAINLTVVNTGMAGYLTAYPHLASRPNAATLNYAANDIRNGFAIVRLDQSAVTHEFSVYSVAQTHLVADIVGYYTKAELPPPQAPVPLSYWATSAGSSPCASVCTATGGFAAATSAGWVCKAQNGTSYAYEFKYTPNPNYPATYYYSCGSASFRTAQCSCLKD